MKKIFVLIAIIIVSFCVAVHAQNTEPFKKGDRIVFEGNSITHLGLYHSYVWLYYMTHFPNRRIQIFNCGVGGDVAEGMYKRLDSDIFAKKPTVIFLTFGMNDVGYSEFLKPNAAELIAKNVAKSYRDYKKIEKRFKAYPQARKVIMSSPPFDETARVQSINYPEKNEAILRIDSFQEASAKKNGWGFIDLNRPMTAINEREQKKDSSFTLEGPGRIHPEDDGYLVMAYLILKSQGLAGKDVAYIDIDAKNKKVNQSVNCNISRLKVAFSEISFNYLAKSLPYPVYTMLPGKEGIKSASDALPYIPFMKEFDNERLLIKNLPEGTYALMMDGRKIGEWSAISLSEGINLAAQTNTPEYQQALAIMELNEERRQIEKKLRDDLWVEYFFLENKGMLFKDNLAAVDTVLTIVNKHIDWRENMEPYITGHYKSVREARKEEMELLVNKIYSINKPVNHQITLRKL